MAGTLTAVAVIGVIGWLDFITGPDIAFSIFYLLPIAACGWRLGFAPALAGAIAASVAWFLADYAHRPWSHVPVSVWNASTRLLVFVSTGALLSTLRRDRDRLASLLEQATQQALVDGLTGLPNSRALRGAIEERRRASSGQVCVAYIDLDNFKRVNDLYGHSVGDEVLRKVAQAMRTTLRSEDLVARVGGDEFVILFGNVADGAEAEAIANRVIAGIGVVGTGFPEAMLGASVGLALLPVGSLDQLIQFADSGMYDAKLAGKGAVRWYDRKAS